ncbi:endonuclease/exonuclease/phosphatase family protein [Cardiobacteriaceae bacterium TAE3-ERU3]|nr:endonuclease/exonuclease/phosphatase family protein [Cardiobacteriaceae bacterium TAE3-ERU3]
MNTIVVMMGVSLLATLLPMLRNGHWMIRGFDFPRVQILSFQAITLIAAIIWGNGHWLIWTGALLTVAAMIYQLVWILPYLPIGRKEVREPEKANADNEISLISSNVLTPNRNSDALIALVDQYKPDMLLTLESDKWWEDKLAVLDDDYPYQVKQPQDNLYGIHLYSRLPLEEAEIRFRVEEDIPSIVAYVILPSGQRVRLYCVHPAPPSPTENEKSDERDAELVLVGEEVKERNEPALVFGDMNDVAWSASTRLFKRVSGLLDPRIGRGLFSTFHAKIPLLRWPLDHLFHSDDFYICSIKRLPGIGSDHFPIFARLQYHPQAENEYVISQMDEEDRERAEETKQQVDDVDQRIAVDAAKA